MDDVFNKFLKELCEQEKMLTPITDEEVRDLAAKLSLMPARHYILLGKAIMLSTKGFEI